MRIGFDATSLTAAGKGIARFQREFLRAAAITGSSLQLDVFVPEQPDEEALPEVAGWRYHRVPDPADGRLGAAPPPGLARRLGLDVVITASERAALWGPPEVVYIYEHPAPPGTAQPRGRDVAPAAARRLDHARCSSGSRCAARPSSSPPPSRRPATSRRYAPPAVVHSGVGDEFSPGDGPRTYLLHIASDDPRDNSEVVIDAYAAYGDDRPPLVVAGPLRAARPALEERARTRPASPTRSAGRASRAAKASSTSTAARSPTSTRRCTRGSGSRPPRRSPAARR